MKQSTVIEIFENQLAKFSALIAVEDAKKSLTYQELNDLSDKFANYMADYFLTFYPNTNFIELPITLMFDRSVEMIVSMLAVNKIGSVFIPLSPDYPDERIRQILQDSNSKMIITSLNLVSKAENCSRELDKELVILSIDGLQQFPDIKKNSSVPINSNNLNPNNLAYIIYTSGTTGKPKGVCIEHKGLVHVAKVFEKLYNYSPGKRVLNFASYTFDAAIFEIFCAILNGATLVIPDKHSILPGDALYNLIKSKSITHVVLPPTALALTEAEGLDSLEIVETAGEPCTPAIAQRWGKGKHLFFNAYGPSEATICVSTTRVNKDEVDFDIGNAIDGIELFILNEDLSITERGQVGELAISGIVLAREYLNLPHETAQKFVMIDCVEGGKRVTKRVYRTGDLVVRNEDNKIIYRGRKDHQVKIRGHRIELAEIESVLNRHPSVTNSIVKYRNVKHEELIAYYIPKSNDISINQLREFAKKFLPDYMIPAAYIKLSEIPLTINGKIDHKALPEPSEQDYGITVDDQSNLDLFQQETLTIIQDLLKIKNVSIMDNFFDIGGHSLLIAQLVLLIKNKFNVSLNLLELLEADNIDSIVKIIKSRAPQFDESRQEPNQSNSFLFSIHQDNENRYAPFPLTDIQQAYYLGRSGQFDLSSVTTNIYREFKFEYIEIERFEMAINKLIKRHDMLHAVILSEQEQKIVENPKQYSISVYDLKTATENKIKAHLADIRQTYSYSILPTTDYPLFKMGITVLPDGYYLHLVIDAIVVDGWSYYIFLSELEKFYNHPDIELPPLEISFRDYVLAEQKVKQSNQYQQDKQYWEERIKALPPGPELPNNANQDLLKSFNTETLRTKISSDLRQKLRQHSSNYNINETILFLAVFSEVLNLWSSTDKFCINITLFNRLPLHSQINNIIGDFTSLELLEVDHSDNLNSTFHERAKNIQSLLYEDLNHRLFSGIEIQRKLATRLDKATTGTLMPIVFTCMLLDENAENIVPKMFSFDNLIFGKTQSSQVWLDFKIFDENNNIVIEWDYIKELFPESIIEDMHQTYIHILNQLGESLETWEKSVFNIKLPYDYMQNEKTVIDFGEIKFPLLQQLIADSVQNYSNKYAVIADNGQLTYRELDELSNRLANHIKNFNATSNPFIPIIMEGGIEQIVAILGILKSGFSYVPIDAHLPEERINELLLDIDASIVITQASFKSKLESIKCDKKTNNLNIITVDQDLNNFSNQPLFIGKSSDDLAYGIFTSGTTGKPKLVMISHRGAVNTILAINKKYRLCSSDVVLSVSNFDFDLSVYDYFGLLAVGGTIILPSYEFRKDPLHWLNLIIKHKVSIWNTVPMLLEMLLEYIKGHNNYKQCITTIRLYLLSGDYIPLKLPDRLKALYNPDEPITVVSLGGATEASIWSIVYEINDINKAWKTIPYGKALPNQEVLILNNTYQICPPGVIGEIYISGIGLADGYWRNQTETKTRFINNPYTHKLIYKTGDLGRYYRDGNIEFLGRQDNQVKISGHRIELGEIEYHLNSHPLVKQGIVSAIAIEGRKNLVAFIVLDSAQPKIKSTYLKTVREYDRNSYSLKLIVDQNNNIPNIRTYREFIEKLSSEAILSVIKEDMVELCDIKQTKFDINNFSILKGGYILDDNQYVRFNYQSANSLYTVRVYLICVNNTVAPTGIYYYDPIHNQFVLITNTTIHFDSNFIIYTNKNIDIPDYIKSDREIFYKIEMGYMNYLLYRQGLIDYNNNSELLAPLRSQLASMMKLEDDEIIIGCQYINRPRSALPAEQFNQIKIYIYIMNGQDKGDLYYITASGSINIVSKNISIYSETVISETNKKVFEQATFFLLFLSEQEVITNREYEISGYLSQYFMMNGLKHNIGFCPIGKIETESFKEIFNITHTNNYIHGLLGGKIQTKQNPDGVKDFDTLFKSKEHEITEFLKKKIPYYMVPQFYYFLDNIPLSNNGKLNIKALNKIALESEHKFHREFVPPRNDLESNLISLWEKILGVLNISVYDKFYSLGGNSLLIIQLANAILAQFKVNVPLYELIQAETIDQQAILLKNKFDQLLTSPSKITPEAREIKLSSSEETLIT